LNGDLNSGLSKDWAKRACPLCGSEIHSDKPVVRSSPRAEQLNFLEAKDYFIGFRKNQVFFSYYRCEKCALLYCPWYFSEVQLNELYSDMPDNLLGENKNVIARTQTGYTKFIAKYVKRVITYLEIGPDIGLVTTSIVNLFSPSNLLLVEPNISVHDQLRINAGSKSNIDIVASRFQLKPAKPDLMVGVHVYDHLLDPLYELTELYSLAANNGKIAIVVHNEKSILSKILRKKWPPFCLQHPQLYNKNTVKNLLSSAGWQVLVTKPTTNWFTLNHFVNMGLSLFGVKHNTLNILPSVSLPIRLGNMILICGKND
jgi:hypothetical protein